MAPEPHACPRIRPLKPGHAGPPPALCVTAGVLCRYQEAPVPPTEAQLARLAHSPLAQGFLWRTRMLKSACTAASPKRHHALGLSGYCQVTSPIRRCAPAMLHTPLHKLVGELSSLHPGSCERHTAVPTTGLSSSAALRLTHAHHSTHHAACVHAQVLLCSQQPALPGTPWFR